VTRATQPLEERVVLSGAAEDIWERELQQVFGSESQGSAHSLVGTDDPQTRAVGPAARSFTFYPLADYSLKDSCRTRGHGLHSFECSRRGRVRDGPGATELSD
jgi:hypothetical protein